MKLDLEFQSRVGILHIVSDHWTLVNKSIYVHTHTHRDRAHYVSFVKKLKFLIVWSPKNYELAPPKKTLIFYGT